MAPRHETGGKGHISSATHFARFGSCQSRPKQRRLDESKRIVMPPRWGRFDMQIAKMPEIAPLNADYANGHFYA
jgi:hypothetical protein